MKNENKSNLYKIRFWSDIVYKYLQNLFELLYDLALGFINCYQTQREKSSVFPRKSNYPRQQSPPEWKSSNSVSNYISIVKLPGFIVE